MTRREFLWDFVWPWLLVWDIACAGWEALTNA